MTRTLATLCAVIFAFAFVDLVDAFYLPGVAPVDYPDQAIVELKVNKLTSVKTQIPYDYYSLPFCRPVKIQSSVQNLGEVLYGDRIQNSLYQVYAKTDFRCQVLCKREYSKNEVKEFAEKVSDEYRVNWILDNLPAATPRKYHEAGSEKVVTTYELGFPLGFVGTANHGAVKKGFRYVNNHVSMTVKYHADESASTPGTRVVGFETHARSVAHTWRDANAQQPSSCSSIETAAPQDVEASGEITWTYDVIWEPSDIKWVSRWDTYLLVTDDQVHWFSIINSLLIVLFLTGMVAMIMMRTIHQDFARYSKLQDTEESLEETGWKLVHADVFRPPKSSMLLCVSVGSGIQVLCMAAVAIFFAVLGFLSPANRGALLTAVLLLYVFMGSFAGYYATLFYKYFKGQAWKTNTLMTAFLYPGVVFTIFFILNFFLWGVGSSAAVPFGTLVALLFLWFGISVPLVFVGSYLSINKEPPTDPVRTNTMPRQIPDQQWYMHPTATILMGGILPFGAIFIELYFIMTSMWQHQFYYIFGFLFLVFFIAFITCSEITIVTCYFQLCAEDYRWWWRAFLTPASSALYMFLYSIAYFINKLEIQDFVSGLLFFSYTFMMCVAFFLMTGTIGFLSGWWFVRKIYSSIKVD
eukprot:TRINITY_DN182_c0_g3_i1.p1 TRINITY_DN182_c0_g3~~TRINITY_DN182_c0_g3_i1.p1  ORF type:complete len:637 (-),score=136.16 TRINITY_DN182_c0_g3_i1:126-2036(-)